MTPFSAGCRPYVTSDSVLGNTVPNFGGRPVFVYEALMRHADNSYGALINGRRTLQNATRPVRHVRPTGDARIGRDHIKRSAK